MKKCVFIYDINKKKLVFQQVFPRQNLIYNYFLNKENQRIYHILSTYEPKLTKLGKHKK